MLLNPQTYVSRTFHPIGKRRGPINVIKLKPDIKPYALSTSRGVPVPLLAKVEEELSRMKQMQIISKVDKPTEWCAGMVVVPKANGKVRICVDLTNLNESILREFHPLPYHTLANYLERPCLASWMQIQDSGKLVHHLSQQNLPLLSLHLGDSASTATLWDKFSP